LSVLHVRTAQNANCAPLASSPPQTMRRRPSSRSAPDLYRGSLGGFTVCYQALERFHQLCRVYPAWVK
jgi:hypothetical protein